MAYGTYMPDLYVCGFTRVAYVLRHAEIRVQGYTEVFNRHTHTHRVSDEGMGRAVKNSLEIIIKQVCLEGGFERGGRIRVVECLREIVPDRWASIRKRSFKFV